MKAKELTVGPILGHTCTNMVRIFGRAELSEENGQPRRAHGIVRIRKKGVSTFSDPLYFKMNPNFDMTGIAIISELRSSTTYEYQMAWVYSDVDYNEMSLNDSLNWEGIDIYEFCTASGNKNQPRTVVMGSCRYALQMLGGMWFDDRGDKTFRSILKKKNKGEDIDQLIMCGDQIYADDLKFLGADNSLEEYNKRYRKAFTSKHLRTLMAQVPTYMTLDDHEIEDNWPESATSKDWVTKFPAAIHAYSTYQASHSPLFSVKNGRIDGEPTHLWYFYQDGCCDFFVCDTRTERYLKGSSPEIIGPRQMDELLNWLNDGSGRVKIIVSSVPPYESESDDKWHGFIDQRDRILEFIHQKSIRKVVFMSGDIHACMSSELVLNNNSKVISVVSSAFFWPYPHPNRRGFKLKGKIQSKTQQEYIVKNSSKVYPADAFSKIVVSPSGIKIDYFSRKGNRLGGKSYSF